MIKRHLTSCLLLIAAALCVHTGAEQLPLVVIHTNDFHGHIAEEFEYAGAARIAALVEKTRLENDGVLVLDAGDAISGTPVSTMFQGTPIFEVMNLIGYDAAALGNHEFDHGHAQIEKFKEIANYPLLSANAFAPTGDLIADAPTLIKEVGGIRVAIVGLITDYTPFMITPTGNENISFAPPMYSVASVIRAVKPHVDLVIALTHVGHEEEKLLARTVPGIDLIVGGHSHTTVDPPVKVGNTWVVQASYYGKHVGYIDLVVDTDIDRITEFEGRLIPAAEMPPPLATVARVVAEWERKVSEVVDVEIARSDRNYTKPELRPILENILAKATNTQIGFYNMGGIRDVVREGPVSARNIWNIEPFGNSLVTVTTDGETLKQILQMDGDSHPGVRSIKGGDTYTFATNSFVAAQAEKRHPGKVTVSDKGVLIRDVLIDHIRTHGLK